MKKTKGFTLVELIIVIVIVGILSIVAVPVYKGYTKKAMGTEAKSLIGAIATAERVYFAEYNRYFNPSEGKDVEEGRAVLDIDARSNKYFTGYTIVAADATEGNASFTATVTGNGGSGAENIEVILVNSSTGNPKITENYDKSGLNN